MQLLGIEDDAEPEQRPIEIASRKQLPKKGFSAEQQRLFSVLKTNMNVSFFVVVNTLSLFVLKLFFLSNIGALEHHFFVSVYAPSTKHTSGSQFIFSGASAEHLVRKPPTIQLPVSQIPQESFPEMIAEIQMQIQTLWGTSVEISIDYCGQFKVGCTFSS